MERSIYFSKIDKLKSHSLGNYDRVYFGNEFCDELIPSLGDLKEAISISTQKERNFSFVTCYVSENKIKKYYSLMELLAKLAPLSEVIMNDWGLLKICLDNYLTPVLGRILVRQKRDPRITDFIRCLPNSAGLRLQQTGLNNCILDFIKTNKVNRIELDNLLQGIDVAELQDPSLSYSVYLPYGYITTTRICFIRNKNKKERFNITPCAYECKNNLVKLYNKRMKEALFMKGNTIFFKNNSESFLESYSRINRIVYEPEMPD